MNIPSLRQDVTQPAFQSQGESLSHQLSSNDLPSTSQASNASSLRGSHFVQDPTHSSSHLVLFPSSSLVMLLVHSPHQL